MRAWHLNWLTTAATGPSLAAGRDAVTQALAVAVSAGQHGIRLAGLPYAGSSAPAQIMAWAAI